MAPKSDADLFNKIIAQGRERQKNEALANAMLGGGNRRASAPGAGSRKAANGSLASRVGISKTPRVQSPLSRPSSATPGNSFRNGNPLHSRPLNRTTSDSRLDRRARAVETFANTDAAPSSLRNQVNFRDNTTNNASFSFRGQARGEWTTVVAQNFAEGTTAADIESVLQTVVDEDVVCKIISATPTVIAEMQFKDSVNADKVVSTFNNKKADGRQLYVYVKDGTNAATPARTPVGPRNDRNDRSIQDDRDKRNGSRREQDDEMDVDEDRRRYDEQRRHDEERRNRRAEPEYQDGRYGFDGRREQDARPAREALGRSDRGLYSDNMMRGRRDGGSGYRGRGGYRGR